MSDRVTIIQYGSVKPQRNRTNRNRNTVIWVLGLIILGKAIALPNLQFLLTATVFDYNLQFLTIVAIASRLR
ncbi:MAG: hypothetical protein AAF378_04920 [Cyanobacteria bacterium P01_A01_bin.84]